MNYSTATQKAIAHIETHIEDTITADDLSSATGYSKYHLLRIFKSETGKTVGEYVKHRRLAVASSLLIEGDESILTIAIAFGFQSQAAFTRAFKDVYHLPPAKYRKMLRLLDMNKEETGMDNQKEIHGWTLSGSNPELYQFGVDANHFHTGKQSGYLFGQKQAVPAQFGTVMQGFQSKFYKGKRVKMSCFIKTEAAHKCGAWMRVDNASGDVLQFDNMDPRPIEGDTDWNYYSIILDVAEESDAIYFGVLLQGSGKVWMDGFQFQEVSDNVENTNLLGVEALPERPDNLDFSHS
ncbi:AraC family transcriptional regulator [Halobacillus litoralis]|uniref:helix-turn-helix domain-containing protein n=1 Tax=Halobacillus litoralis TaxID=45668 RepID=UPI001CD6A6E7|nr:AraC family transcriptional regulator [Halobacillus litoralis]MCA0972134.1 AraC family transcriptional regulator [Halobacillus litoralis]